MAYKQRLGWTAEWVSSLNSDFNFDLHVSFTDEQMASGKLYYNYETIDEQYGLNELPGLSVFYKDDAGQVFHTYSSYARGNEEVIGAFIYLDMTPKGRNETDDHGLGEAQRRVRAAARRVVLSHRRRCLMLAHPCHLASTAA